MKNTQVKKPFSGSFRAAITQDLPKIMAIESSSFDSTQAYPSDDMDEYLQKSLTNPKTPFILAFAKAAARHQPKIAGYGLGDIEKNGHGTVVSIAVKKSFRGQQLGRKLLERVCENLKKSGASQTDLEVEATNKVAIHIYETSGFIKDRVLHDYYGKTRHAYLMTLRFKT